MGSVWQSIQKFPGAIGAYITFLFEYACKIFHGAFRAQYTDIVKVLHKMFQGAIGGYITYPIWIHFDKA